MKNLQPHLLLKNGDISPYVLLPGDPARVLAITKFLSKPKKLAANREFVSYSGEYKGKLITICSTGIGGPSTAIAAEELIRAGARVLIRVGTCGGSWRNDIPAGSLIIPMAAVRDEGTTKEFIPLGFPAVADLDIVNALRQSAEDITAQAFVGINRTHDSFYGSQQSIARWGEYLRDESWKGFDTPILSSDMETAPLLVIASLRGAKAGAVLAVNAGPEPLLSRIDGKNQKVITESDEQITKQTIKVAIRVALEAMLKL